VSDRNAEELNPVTVEVSTLGVTSREEGEISKMEEANFPSASDIGVARTVVTPLEDLPAPPPTVPPFPASLRGPHLSLFPHTIWAIEEDSLGKTSPSAPSE
jgi:hypothetical protein